MKQISFKKLTPEGLNKHRWTCPLEIWRYRVKNGIKEVLHGPLERLNIFTEIESGSFISTATLNGMKKYGDFKEIPVVEWSDWVLYSKDEDWAYQSITKA
jgi:hypothetical protein